LRVSYVTGHWSVTGRSAGQGVVCGLVARPDVGLFGPFGRMHVFFVCYFVLCNVNWKTLTASLFDCYILGYKIPE